MDWSWDILQELAKSLGINHHDKTKEELCKQAFMIMQLFLKIISIKPAAKKTQSNVLWQKRWQAEVFSFQYESMQTKEHKL